MIGNASLVVVGLGIKFKSHITIEAHAYIREADKVFYLVNEPAMKEWIQRTSPRSESLDFFYSKFSMRTHAYQAMTAHVLDALRKNQHICFVLYGHPTVFAKPALDAVKQAKLEGYDTKILPGISAEDCLFADLSINPAWGGCLSYEATDLLLYQRLIDNRSHIIVWQVGIIGIFDYPSSEHDNARGAQLLVDYLKQFYEDSHVVTLYEAAQYPHLQPRITPLSLNKLHQATFSPLTTLYIPPARESFYNYERLNDLKKIINENKS